MTIIIATYGDDSWRELANERAFPSALRQDVPVMRFHGSDLPRARNEAAARAHTEWLCFLDADDELEDGYIAALMAADGDLRAPAVAWTTGSSSTQPVTLHERDIINGLNPCVIGTLIRRDLFADVGGFWEWPAYEDWCLFRRAALSGARIEHVPGAVYRAQIRPGSRNQSVKNPRQLMREIKDTHASWLEQRQGIPA